VQASGASRSYKCSEREKKREKKKEREKKRDIMAAPPSINIYTTSFRWSFWFVKE